MRDAGSVYASYAFGWGDVVFFWDKELCSEASVSEVCYDSFCDFAGVEGFAELAVGGAFTGSVKAVAVVNEDEHKNRELVVSRFPMRI